MSNEILARTVVNTQLRDDDDLELGALPDDVELSLRAVRARRVCYGDEGRKYVGRYVAQAFGECTCIFGCVDRQGRPRRVDWYHACFECREESLVAARDTYAVKADGAACLLDRDTMH